MVPRVAVSAFVFPTLVWREFAIRPTTLWTQAWLRPLAAMVPFIAASVFMDRAWAADAYLPFFTQVALALPLAIVGAWFVGTNSSERILATSWIRQRFR
jgi:hypothetical protein